MSYESTCEHLAVGQVVDYLRINTWVLGGLVKDFLETRVYFQG